jgi:O-antigen/teichoic acid export membrane protein
VILFGSLTASVLGPNMSHMWEDGNHAEVIRRIHFALRLTLMVLLGVAVFLLGVSPWVIRWICGPAYAASASLIWVFLIYQLFNSAFYVLGLYPLLVEKPLISLYALSTGLLTNVLANLYLIPRMGVLGGAFSAAISMVVVVISMSLMCRREGFHFEGRTFRVMALMFLPAIPSRLGLLAASALVLALVLWTDWILSRDERAVLVDKVRGMLRPASTPAGS